MKPRFLLLAIAALFTLIGVARLQLGLLMQLESQITRISRV